MEDFIRLLKTLSEARGPSGLEDEVREVVIREMEPYVDEVVDRWGNPALRDHIINIAREVGIPYQLEVLYGGTTDAMAIAFRREGVSAVALSIPTRYVHSPVELLDVRDAVNAAALLRHVIEKMPPFSSRPDEGGSRAREARRPPGPGHRPVGASGPLLGWRDDGWRSGAGPLGPAGARLPEERCAFLYDDLFL